LRRRFIPASGISLRRCKPGPARNRRWRRKDRTPAAPRATGTTEPTSKKIRHAVHQETPFEEDTDARSSQFHGAPTIRGAAGQIGYELYVKRRPRDGHNMLFGNMGAELIMYVIQKPDYNFPRDFVYFSQVEIDDSCIFVNRNSPFKTIEDVVAAAKKRTLNVSVSRLPTQTSIGVLALADATGSRYNLIPYGGGNPSYIAVLNGEVDIGAGPMVGVMTLIEKFKILGVFNRKQNVYAALSENAPTVNSVFGIDIPDLFTARAWGIHTEWVEKNPEQFALLERTAQQAHASSTFREGYRKTGATDINLMYGDRKACTEYALKTLELARRYETALTAKRGSR
jgi:hypothetical protein